MRSNNLKSGTSKPAIAFLGTGLGIPGENSPGQGIPSIRALMEKLSQHFDIVIYSLIRIQKNKVPEGIHIRQVTSRRLPMRVKYLLLLMHFMYDHWHKSFSIIHAVSAFPAGRMAVILGKIFRIPTVVKLIGSEAVKMPEIGYGDLLNPRLGKIVRWVCAETDALVAVSEYQRKLVDHHLGLRRPILVLPLRIDVNRFPYTDHQVSFPVEFLYIAANIPVKDPETLFRAFAKILKSVPAHLTVIGDGFPISSVEKMLVELAILDHVKLVGIVKNEDLAGYFAKAHILLHTARYESGCGVAQEAMASGVPVCGTEVGILADLGEPFAIVVATQDPDALAKKTLELISDPNRYRRQQSLAREYIVNHEADWAAKQYKDLFEKWIKVP